MFQRLGQFVSRYWLYLIPAWLLLLGGLLLAAPAWKDVVQDGEFAFLPADAASRRAERSFANAFPDDLLASQIVIVVRREHNPAGLREADRKFVSEVLVPEVKRAVGFVEKSDRDEAAEEADPDSRPVVSDINWFDSQIGDQLDSADKKATLVLVQLRHEFMNFRNADTVRAIENLIAELRGDAAGARQQRIPPGLDLAISGNATFGRDMLEAAEDSSKATERWTIILVIALLLLIYRSPVLALIPLLTVAVATEISLAALAILASHGWIELFAGIETYVIVVVYGAGVDYCLFLIARYKEELDGGATLTESVTLSLTRVGAAVTASAGTVMCGIGMMVFAEFGKFQQAGVAITFGLFIVLCAALTLTPSVLRMAGRWAFWPNVRSEKLATDSGWIAPTSIITQLRDRNIVQAGWERVGRALLVRPATIWLVASGLMLPFAVIGVLFFGNLSYGLLSELPDTAPSVQGTRAVQQHFPHGEVGPMTVLVRREGIDFSDKRRRAEGRQLIDELTQTLYERRRELGVAKVRSVTAPKGLPSASGEDKPGGLRNLVMRGGENRYAYAYYVSSEDNSTTRIDLILEDDPFTRDSIAKFGRFQQQFADLLPEGLRGADLSFVGATASVSDLKAVTDRDQIRIDLLVLIGVFLILVVLLRRPMISLYLIASVFFSYLATLGVTFCVFYLSDPGGFAGLDWKVPLFLFTILIAVGEDYNIFLITRIDEESDKHGPVKGITIALERTGSIISSCGIIMAGTFSSLLAGSLVGMDQLGFALAFGVLLDTFVVRPILVPSYLILLHSGRLGRVGYWLGARPVESDTPV